MVVITIPNSKPPNEEIGAVEFTKTLSDTLFSELTVSGEEKGFSFLYGQDHKEIVNVETVQGKNTEYVRNFYQQLKSHAIHVDLRSYDAEDEVLKQFDVAVAYLSGLTDMKMVEALVNMFSETCEAEMVEAEYSTHRLSLVSEALFDTPSIILYVNEGAVDLYSAVCEDLALYLVERPVVRKIE